MLAAVWIELAAAQVTDRPDPRPRTWTGWSSPLTGKTACKYGSVRTCQAIYEGEALCAAVRPLCEVGSQHACEVARSSECACLAGDAAACTAFATRLAEGGEEAERVLKVLEDPCLAGVMTACTAITDHLLRQDRPELAHPWLVFTCDRGVTAACTQLESLPR